MKFKKEIIRELVEWGGTFEEMIELARVVRAVPHPNGLGFRQLILGDETLEVFYDFDSKSYKLARGVFFEGISYKRMQVYEKGDFYKLTKFREFFLFAPYTKKEIELNYEQVD